MPPRCITWPGLPLPPPKKVQMLPLYPQQEFYFKDNVCISHSTAEELCKHHTLPSLVIPSHHPSVHAALPGTVLVPFKLSTVISPLTSIPVKTGNCHLLRRARAHGIVFISESKSQTYSNALPRLMWFLYLYCYLLSKSSEESFLLKPTKMTNK